MTTLEHFEVLMQSSQEQQHDRDVAEILQRFESFLKRIELETKDWIQKPACLKGKIAELQDQSQISLDSLEEFASCYPVHLQSPFEDVAAIAGGIWQLSSRSDALLKLVFQPWTQDLPIHSHDYSERVIFVLDGRADFVVADQHGATSEVKVSRGDVLVFFRGTKHTFRTAENQLVLMSYHSPFIELDDPRQFRLIGELNPEKS
ncbi:MAG: cupin domain-containing protein [bacterium]|nr:cupin domain-containing protein [bacterium]